MKARDWSGVVGEVHGRLRIVGLLSRDAAGKMLVRCICTCGNEAISRYNNVGQGNAKSCGCLKAEITTARNFKHGLSYHPLFQCWVDMNKRCHNPLDENYHNYGGRGIFVCEQWRHSPAQFIADMGERPEGYTLERKKNHLGYSPDNCIWSPMIDQQNNKRTNVVLTHAGESMTIAQWARRLGMKKVTLNGRIAANWPVDVALTTPVKGAAS